MKLPPILLSLVLMAGLISCKKETTEPSPVFNPVGYWRGNASHLHAAILNKSDGKSRIYFRIHGQDTAGATIGDGSYTFTGNTFKGSYLLNNNPVFFFIDAGPEHTGILKGQLYNSISPDIVDCTLHKQE